jgi:hypothetical protein
MVSDTRLIDPTAKAVLAALEGAFRALPEAGFAHVRHTRMSLTRAAKRAAYEPEGVAQWSALGTGSQVLAAWWTALSGRRHVRVVARAVPRDQAYLHNESKLGTRPAVWHVFPERVYRRRVGKVNELIAVCACGAVGTEKALGWAGPCCGPCADFADDHGPQPTAPALFGANEPCFGVGASADGSRILTQSAKTISVRDATGALVFARAFERDPFAMPAPPPALSPCGRYVAHSEPDAGRFRVFDLNTQPALDTVGAFAFHPTSGALYLVSNGGVLVCEQPLARPVGTKFSLAVQGGPVAFSANGERVALRTESGIQVYEADGTPLARVPLPASLVNGQRPTPGAPHVALSADGSQVAVALGFALAVHHAVTGERRFYNGKLDDGATGAAFDASGKWLLVSQWSGSLVAHPTDTFAPERTAVLRWSLGPVGAMTACGDAIVTACDEGAKVWPVAQLLSGV